MLGNCVYDKDYVARVTKLKVAPVSSFARESKMVDDNHE